MGKYIAMLVLGLVCFSGYSADFSFGFRVGEGHGYRPYYRPNYGGIVVYERIGHWETRCETIVIKPACYEKVWVEPVYVEKCDEKGNKFRVLVSNGYFKEYYHPEVYGTRNVDIWVY